MRRDSAYDENRHSCPSNGRTALTKDMAEEIIYSALTNDQIARFEKNNELDASFPVKMSEESE